MAQQLEFYLLESTDREEFSEAVQQRLNTGWHLHGGLFAFPDYITGNKVDTVRYLQAFVKDVTQREATGFKMNR